MKKQGGKNENEDKIQANPRVGIADLKLAHGEHPKAAAQECRKNRRHTPWINEDAPDKEQLPVGVFGEFAREAYTPPEDHLAVGGEADRCQNIDMIE